MRREIHDVHTRVLSRDRDYHKQLYRQPDIREYDDALRAIFNGDIALLIYAAVAAVVTEIRKSWNDKRGMIFCAQSILRTLWKL